VKRAIMWGFVAFVLLYSIGMVVYAGLEMLKSGG
jgi:hypothetical protein